MRQTARAGARLLNGIAAATFTPPPDDSDASGIMNPADAVTRYRSSVPPALDRIRVMSGDQLLTPLSLLLDM